MIFADRTDAGRRLAALLDHLRGADVVVLGLPRGGVPVAAEVAKSLGAPLDVLIVRKMGVPFLPELAMGAVGEGGIRVVNRTVVHDAGISPEEFAIAEDRARREVVRRAARYRANRPRVPLTGKVAVVVDDGIATGATVRAACQVARAQGAARVVLAAPVAPEDRMRGLRQVADELVFLQTPPAFLGIGEFYADFSQTPDDEVVALLACETAPAGGEAGPRAPSPDEPPERDEDVEILADGVRLRGHLTVPDSAPGVVVFAHGSGSGRHSPRNRFVASVLNRAGLGTLLFDLLTAEEETDRANVFDIPLLARRLAGATRWLRGQPQGRVRIGYFGASTGAAAALVAAAEPDAEITAVVSRGGRPDLAGPRLCAVRAATLLIVGGDDGVVLRLNRQAQAQLNCRNQLTVIPGATHLFEEPGTLQAAAEAARDWFVDHFCAGAASGEARAERWTSRTGLGS